MSKQENLGRARIPAVGVILAAGAALALAGPPARADEIGPVPPGEECPSPKPCHLVYREVWVPTGHGSNVGCVSDTDPPGRYETYTVYQGYNWVDSDGTEYWGGSWLGDNGSGGRYPRKIKDEYNTFECTDTNISPGP